MIQTSVMCTPIWTLSNTRGLETGYKYKYRYSLVQKWPCIKRVYQLGSQISPNHIILCITSESCTVLYWCISSNTPKAILTNQVIHDPSKIVATDGLLMIAVTGKAQEDGYTSESSPSKNIIIMMLNFILLLHIITQFPHPPQMWSWNVVHLRWPNRLAARTMSFHLKAWVGRGGGFCLPSTSWLRSMFLPSYHHKGRIQQL